MAWGYGFAGLLTWRVGVDSVIRPSSLPESPLPIPRLPFATGLRSSLAEGYRFADLRRDVLAGLTVGVVALPLSMALAIATGLPPEAGLATAIVAGAVIALTGGTRTSVSGPTAAFVVVLVPIGATWGAGGLLVASAMAGGLLVLLGVARLGRLISFIPYPVTTGFTAGIGVVIAVLQLKDLLGLPVAHLSEDFPGRAMELVRAVPHANGPDVLMGAVTLAILVLWPRLTRRVPAPLVALVAATTLAYALERLAPGMRVETIGSRFGEMPATVPVFRWPWDLPGPGGEPLGLSLDLLRRLSGPALAIGLLGAIESLLCAVVADGLTGQKHDPDAELIGQGLGNLIAPFFGGFAATGAIARTATNIRAGGRSPVAALVHSGFVLAAMISLAPLLSRLPMASLAAILLVVAWNMAELPRVVRVVRQAPRSDTLVLLTCFGLTVFIDMVAAVTVGVLLAALLFMRRMAEITETRLADPAHPDLAGYPLPEGVVLYEIAGPLFFGAAEKAVATLDRVSGSPRAMILWLDAVPAMDLTGVVALRSVIARLEARGVPVVLAGVKPQPKRALTKAGIVDAPGRIGVFPTLDQAAAWLHLTLPDGPGA